MHHEHKLITPNFSSQNSHRGAGNATTDKNRGIGDNGIRYNILNLPREIVFNGVTMQYHYDGAGTKLRMSHGQPNTKYAGAFEYNKDNLLTRISVDEGQINITNGGNDYSFEYYLRDHLGNTRSVMNEAGTMVQETEYMPFGLAIPRTAGTNKYPGGVPLYNGKEKQPETGYLDYGARQYDASIGRWMVVDPLAEKREWLSPYNYVQNNPILRIDPNGAFDDYYFGANGKLDKYEEKNEPDKVFVQSGKNDAGEKTYTELDAKGVKQFVAIIVGEASNNMDEAKGIASVMENRMDHKDVELKEGFVDKIGGKKDFDAIGGKQYNKVMGQSLKETHETDGFKTRMEGAMSALSPLTGDNTSGALFWNATSQKNEKDVGFNWRMFNNKVYNKTAEVGKTTFFKYNPNKVENPNNYKKVWP